MWIKSTQFKSKRDYEQREKAYAEHLSRVKNKFSPNVFFWIGEERLHDARLKRFSFSESLKTAVLEFRYVGLWLGEPPKRPKPRVLILRFKGVQKLTFCCRKNVSTPVHDLTYIQGELNTHPDVRRSGKLRSMNFCFIGSEPFEMELLFEAVTLIESKKSSAPKGSAKAK